MSLYEIKLELLKLLVGGPFNSDAYKAVQAAVDIIFFPWSLIEDKQPTEVKKYLVTKTLTNKEGESYNIVEFERWDGEKFIYYISAGVQHSGISSKKNILSLKSCFPIYNLPAASSILSSSP